MTSIANSFPPSTIALIIVLNESIDSKEFEPNNPVTGFLIERMIDLNSARWENFSDFEKDLIRSVTNAPFIQRLKERFSTLRNFNDLYKYLMATLKNIRIFNTKPDSLGNTKSDQGHVLDLFVRRVLLSFNKLTFSDIIKVYDQFKLFLMNKYKASAQPVVGNEAATQKIYQSLQKFSYLYDFDEIQSELEKLESSNQQSKPLQLRSISESNDGNFMRAIDYLHRYFDKNLRFLSNKEKVEGAINKIGHSVLNFAYLTLKHGYYDEALRAIAETLRIAQNNADEESINHSLIYLYNIAGILGLHKDEILLAEHAITHSLNLNNPILMLYSSLSYAQLERHYDCSLKHRDLLKTRNISWTNALNFASKKLYSHFEQLALVNRVRDPLEDLFIPKTYQKLVKALIFETISEPKMVSLYINSIYEQNPQLLFTNEAIQVMLETAFNALNSNPMKALEILRMYKNNVKLHEESKYNFFLLATCLALSLNRNEFLTASYLEKVLFDSFEQSNIDPNLIALAWSLKNKRLIKQEDYSEAYQSCLCLIEYNRKRGYVKDKLLNEYLNLAIIFSRTGDHIKALEQVEYCIKATKKFRTSIKYHANMLKAYLLCHIEKQRSALRILEKLESKGINDLPARLIAYYNYVKAIVLCSLTTTCENEMRYQIATDCQHYLNRALEIYINLGSLEEIREIYYIQARLYYDLDLYKHRETASQYFMLAENLLGFFSRFNEVSQLCLRDSRLLHLQETILSKISEEFRVIVPSILRIEA